MFTHSPHSHIAAGFPARCKRCGGLLKEPVAFCIHCGIHHPLDAELASRTTQPVQPSSSATPSTKAAATVARTSTDRGTRANGTQSVDDARSAGAVSPRDAAAFEDATNSSDTTGSKDVTRSSAGPSFDDATASGDATASHDATEFNAAAIFRGVGPFQDATRSSGAMAFNVAVPPASAALFNRVAPSTDAAPYLLPTVNVGVPEPRMAAMPHEFLEPGTTKRRKLHAEGAVMLGVLMLAFGVGWLWMSDRSEPQSPDEGPARAATGAVALSAPDRLMSMLADVGSGRLASEKPGSPATPDTPDMRSNVQPPDTALPSNADDVKAAVASVPANPNAPDATAHIEDHVGMASAGLAAHDSPHAQSTPETPVAAPAERSDARELQGDATSRVSRRDAALAKARACLKSGLWDCVRASSSEALAIDGNNAEAQALMQQAIVASGWAPLSRPAPHGSAAPPAVAARPPKTEAGTRRTHRHAVSEVDDGSSAGGDDDTRAIVELGWKRAPAGGASAPAGDVPSR